MFNYAIELLRSELASELLQKIKGILVLPLSWNFRACEDL
jgi:hypothetical protein